MKTRTLLLVALIAAVVAVLVFSTIGLAASPLPGAGPTKYKLVSRGQYASVSWSSDSRWGNVYVARTKVGADAETYLSYDIYECDEWECYSVEAGYGVIPNGDFVPGAELNTDTSAIPGFTFWAGSGGVISVKWTPVKGVSYRYHGISQQRFYDYRYKSNGIWEYLMADAQGSVVGEPIQGVVWAETGTNHNVTVEMSRKR